MQIGDLTVELVDFSKASTQLKQVRFSVFVEEQKVPADMEMDDKDAGSTHALASIGSVAIGTGRLLPDGHIGRVAVLAAYRGKGIGLRIMDTLLDEARRKLLEKVVLSAQLTAVGFYEGLGFQKRGDSYLEAGIEHVDMEMSLID